ncbi:MAG TPA: hypothetical protein PKY10_06355, partial [Lentisphaeria bacterium]|nr:hypothetical protein [Lentisphaeria bacterium]
MIIKRMHQSLAALTAWLILTTALVQADNGSGTPPALIMPPYETLFSRRTFPYWAALSGPRQDYAGGAYQWKAIPSERVIPSHGRMGEPMLYPVRTIHDAWNLKEDVYFWLDNGEKEGSVTLHVEVTLPDGARLHGQKKHTLKNWGVPERREDVIERRVYSISRGLHWLQKRQRPTGGWTDRRWVNYYAFEEYDDFYVDPPPDEPKTSDNQHLFEQDDCFTLVNAAVVLWAFGNCGFGMGDLHNNPFRGTVKAGIDYIMARAHRVSLPAGGDDYDHNRNGQGVIFGDDQRFQGYIHPMIVAGLLAAGLPGHAVTVEGAPAVLADVVEDAYDIMARTLLSWGKGGWPYQYDVDNGFDQSIAGWHYMAIDAVRQWGIHVSLRVYHEYMQMLQRHYDDSTGWFFYKRESPSMTMALAASGLTGLAMAAAADPSRDVTETNAQQTATAGEMLVRATEQLNLDIRLGGRGFNGYFMWTAVRALQKLGIQKIFSLGTAVDWRYTAVPCQGPERRAVWSLTIDYQGSDGRWAFNKNSFKYMDYSDELETAFMLLVLSDEVVRDTGRFSQLCVTTTIPNEIASGLTVNPFQSQAATADNSVQLAWEQDSWDGQGVLDLSLQYILPVGLGDGVTQVQNEVKVEYMNTLGAKEMLTIGPLHVVRQGARYGLDLAVPTVVEVGDLAPIRLEVTLPRGDCQRLVSVPAGVSGEIQTLFADSLDGPVQWVGVEWIGAEITTTPWASFACLPHELFRNPLPITMTATPGAPLFQRFEKSSGKVLIASVPLADPRPRYLLVWYLDAPICLTVTATPVNSAQATCLWSQTLTAADFGKAKDSTEMTWETADLTPGQYVICARITRHPEEVLAEQQGKILLTSTETGALIGEITSDQTTYRHH